MQHLLMVHYSILIVLPVKKKKKSWKWEQQEKNPTHTLENCGFISCSYLLIKKIHSKLLTRTADIILKWQMDAGTYYNRSTLDGGQKKNQPKFIFQVRSIEQESWHKDLLSLGRTVILMPGSLSFINGRFPDFLSSSLISKIFFAQTFPWTRPLSSYEQKCIFYVLTLWLKRYLKSTKTLVLHSMRETPAKKITITG